MSLKSIYFADLLISTKGYHFRYLKGASNPITVVDEIYHAEIKKIVAELNIRIDNGEHEFFYSYQNIPFRASIVETVDGVGYFLRRLKLPIPELDCLGFSPAMLNTLKCLGNKRGMILIAGATGSGKSTTIYSLLKEYVSTFGDIVIAIEDPPEIPVQGCYGDNSQGIWYQIDARQAGGYENAMISAMRYNPKYIFLGEIRSAKTAKEAIRAAVNGHLVVSTIHGNTVQGAIYALQQIAASEGDIELVRSILGDGLLCVIHQELAFTSKGERILKANMLYVGGIPAIVSKIRSGKLELLSNEIESQKILLSRGINLASEQNR
ncbi:ATPase, T2SS/T4P/T4SS family [Escherichia coli]|uniref:ATPase, T2SS/T4P/T4SS family n=1 Tax=Escherichia coli TaxID=562 RepID=UPI00050BB6C3|nr:ATPase, T2SS/T4P/T4SS family [Escherichia coli]MDK2457111.1 ATPase, T2SS/T4P/T4SS family [Escherichia coli]